jgi:hypothetical protein
MNTIFTTDDPENYTDKINLDELYEKKKIHDISTTKNYNTILNRIHNRIRTTSRQQLTEQYCWFIVPEMMIGVPKFDQGTCIAYVIDKLQTNGFNVRYTHPNLLFISWKHWVPDYVRAEIKKRTGTNIDGYGNIIKTDEETNENTPNLLLKNFKSPTNTSNTSNSVNPNIPNDTKAIESYKPSGNLIYNSDIINSLKNNFKK